MCSYRTKRSISFWRRDWSIFCGGHVNMSR